MEQKSTAILPGNLRHASVAPQLKSGFLRCLFYGQDTSRAASQYHWGAVAVVVAVAVLAMLPAFIKGMPWGGDLYNHFLFAAPFYEAIQSGDWYPGWLAESNAGYGDARFRFYPPALYYLLCAVRALTGNWHAAALLTFTLLTIAGSLGVYFWARAFLSPKLAMWAGVIYTLVPFHLNELYRATMLAEYAACAVLPFAFAFVERICRERRRRDVAGLAAAYGLLILTHAPLMVIGSIALFVYALLRIEGLKNWRTLLRLASGMMIGLAASAFYWATMLREMSWIKSSKIQYEAYYDYHVNFLFSPFSLVNLNTWYADMMALATIGIFVPAIVLLRRKPDAGSLSRGLKVIGLLAVFSVFMATDLSRPLWRVVPKLGEVQFPWRWLAITSMTGSIFLAASLPCWIEKARKGCRPLDLLPVLSVAMSLCFIVSQIFLNAQYVSRAEFEQKLNVIRGRGAASYNYWAPVWTTDVLQVRRMNDAIEVEQRDFNITSWDTQHRTFHVAEGRATEARLRTFYYPHWVATAQGKTLSTRAAKDGALLVALPAEAVAVELQFREPVLSKVSAIVSTFAWLLTAALFITGLRRRSSREYDS